MDYIDKKKYHSCHFGEDNIIINEFVLNAVHQIPNDISTVTEIDYYLDTGYNIYLLRLINSDKNKITVIGGELDYIIVEKRLNSNIDNELRDIIEKIKMMNISENISQLNQPAEGI